jgi:hypothetical protein
MRQCFPGIAREPYQAAVRDGDAVCVARQIGEHGLRTCERALGVGPLNGPPLRRENPAVVMLIDTVRRALTDLLVVRHRVIERDRDPELRQIDRVSDVTVMPTVRAEMSRFDEKFDKPRFFARCISYATKLFEAQRRQQPKGS